MHKVASILIISDCAMIIVTLVGMVFARLTYHNTDRVAIVARVLEVTAVGFVLYLFISTVLMFIMMAGHFYLTAVVMFCIAVSPFFIGFLARDNRRALLYIDIQITVLVISGIALLVINMINNAGEGRITV